jgi:stage V sporulation protein B
MSAAGTAPGSPPATTPHSIAKNTVFSYATQLTTAGLTAVLTLFLVRALGPDEYGLFALALSVSSIAISLADCGITGATARFVAETHGRHAEAGPLIVDGLKLKIPVTGLLCVLLWFLATPIADAYDEPGLAWPMRAIAIATFGQSLVLMLTIVGNSLGRTATNLRLVAAESVLEVSASITLVLLGMGAAGAAFGRAIGYMLGVLIGGVLILRLVGRPPLRLRNAPGRATIRRVARYAGALFVVDTAYTLSGSVNVLLLGAYAGSAASGLFQAPMRLIVSLNYVGLSVANGVAPRMARRAGHEPNVRALHAALRGLIGFQCLLLAPVIVWAKPITSLLLGSEFVESADVLVALAPFIFFSGFAPILSISINYLGEARRRVPIALATVVIMFATSAMLIPRHGPVGAAIATDIGFGVYTLAHLWLCRRLLKLPLAGLAPSLASGLTSAAVMALVLVNVGTDNLTPAEWLFGGISGLTAYISTMVFTRELRMGDVARATKAARSRWPRLRRPSPAAESPPAPTATLLRDPQAAAPPRANDDGQRKRPSTETYEIAWRADDETGVFELHRLSPHSEGTTQPTQEPVAASRPFPWGWRVPPAPVPEARDAHARLVKRLLAQGWEPAGRGDAWFAERFRRT